MKSTELFSKVPVKLLWKKNKEQGAFPCSLFLCLSYFFLAPLSFSFPPFLFFFSPFPVVLFVSLSPFPLFSFPFVIFSFHVWERICVETTKHLLTKSNHAKTTDKHYTSEIYVNSA